LRRGFFNRDSMADDDVSTHGTARACARRIVAAAILLLAARLGLGAPVSPAADSYASLVTLFEQWREFERPIMHGEVADYGAAAMAAKAAALPKWRKRLGAIDIKDWPIDRRNDYKLVAAEMSGLDFNLRILRPWARDPAFYVSVWPSRSDVPSREGPVAYPEIELYKYRFPLSPAAQRELAARIGAIPELLEQARENLKDSNARDLWTFGVQELQNQSRALASLQSGTLTVSTLEGSQHADFTGVSSALQSMPPTNSSRGFSCVRPPRRAPQE